MSDVFISYSHLDKDFVGKLHEALLAKDQNVWVDWEDIPPSQSWWEEIQKGIAKANNIVLILSPYSMGSVVCHMEIEYARSLKKRIIPVLHAPYERDACVAEINKRLAKPEEFTTREIWGTRQPLNMYDANDSGLKHINFFFFGNDDDFETKFASLFEIIHTDYDYKEQHTTYFLRASEWNRRGRDASFLLLDTELDQAEIWLKSSPGKQPAPTDLQLDYIKASEKRTRQLRNIRRASIIGTAVAGIAMIFAVGASLVGIQATQSANLASTREASANIQVANANGQLTAVPPTLTQVNKAVVTAQGAANLANTAVVNAQATVTQIPPTLTQAAVIQNIVVDFANVMFQVDNPAGQLEQMNQVVEKYPNQAAAYQARGAYYDKRGEIDLAIKDYTQAIALNPKDSDSYTLRANLLADKGEVDAALEDFNKAIALNPQNATAYHNRGLTRQSTGDIEGALADINQAISLEPQNASFYVSRGGIQNEMGNFDKAIADFDKSLSLFSNNAIAYYGRGMSYYNLNNYAEAISNYDQAIALDLKDSNTYSNRGLAYSGMGDFKSAVADYDKAISLDPKNATAYSNRGLAYSRIGDYKSAVADYDKAISLDPKDPTFYINRGATRILLENYEGALEDLNQGISLDPTNATAYNLRGTAQYYLNDFKNAIDDYTQAITLNPQDLDSYASRGNSRYNSDDFKGAIEDYTQAIELDPTNAIYYLNRGKSRYSVDNSKGALEDLNKAISLNPQLMDAYVSRGDLYYTFYQAETDHAQELVDLKNVLSDYRTAQSLGYEITSDQEEILQQIEALLATATPTP